jgi:hypothetical protein
MERISVASEVVSVFGSRSFPPVRDVAYRQFVRNHVCAVCGKSWSVEACHTGGHGIAQKSCDLSCIPLCRKHHQEFDRGPRAFAEQHGIDVPVVVARLRAGYQKKEAA